MNTERLIVAKFGGSSLANAEGFNRVANIVDADPARRIIVVSAPGKVFGGSEDFRENIKVTDLLIICGRLFNRNILSNTAFGIVESRFLGIADQFGICIRKELDEIKGGLLVKRENEELAVQWAASRGEWLSGIILARHTGAEFVDATEVMRFYGDGTFDEGLSYKLMQQRIRGSERFIVPGFYGQDSLGRIRTFTRGGSDITGSHLAAALGANIYENWTDVKGVMTADPKKDTKAVNIPRMTFEKIIKMSLGGAEVLHHSSIAPVRKRGIPIIVRNTFDPMGDKTEITEYLNNFLLEKSWA